MTLSQLDFPYECDMCRDFIPRYTFLRISGEKTYCRQCIGFMASRFGQYKMRFEIQLTPTEDLWMAHYNSPKDRGFCEVLTP